MDIQTKATVDEISNVTEGQWGKRTTAPRTTATLGTEPRRSSGAIDYNLAGGSCMTAVAGVGTGSDWRQALDQALTSFPGDGYGLVFAFASHHYQDAYPELLASIRGSLRPLTLLGCSGQGVIGTGIELEEEPAISVLALRLPGASLRPLTLTQSELETLSSPEATRAFIGVASSDVNAWVVFADPFTFDADRLLASLGAAYPGLPVVGGLASAGPGVRATTLFLDGAPISSGAVLLALGGAWKIHPLVSQGAEPIGQTWTVTGADRNLILSLGGRPALEVLLETMHDLPLSLQERASRNLLVGLAIDEYRDEFVRGDFLIRNLMGVHKESGSLAIGALPRVGQTVQFQIRDAGAASEELRLMLARAGGDFGDKPPNGALVCSCNGRGVGLFGEPHHDAMALLRQFGELPAAGLFCNGELGPVRGKNFVHGFTASIAFFVPAG